MKEIKGAVYSNVELNNNQIMYVFEEIGKAGNIIIIKNDGQRVQNNFTVVISSSSGKFDSIRYDAASLNEGLTKCLRKYFDVSDL